MKQKQVPVKREFWEKLLDVDMSDSPSATLNVEQPKMLQMVNNSGLVSDELPTSNPTESAIGDTVIGESLKDTLKIDEYAIRCFLVPDIDVGEILPPIPTSADVAGLSLDDQLPSTAINHNPTSIKQFAEAIGNHTTGITAATEPTSDAMSDPNEFFETIPFEQLDAGSLAHPDNKICQKKNVIPQTKA